MRRQKQQTFQSNSSTQTLNNGFREQGISQRIFSPQNKERVNFLFYLGLRETPFKQPLIRARIFQFESNQNSKQTRNRNLNHMGFFSRFATTTRNPHYSETIFCLQLIMCPGNMSFFAPKYFNLRSRSSDDTTTVHSKRNRKLQLNGPRVLSNPSISRHMKSPNRVDRFINWWKRWFDPFQSSFPLNDPHSNAWVFALW